MKALPANTVLFEADPRDFAAQLRAMTKIILGYARDYPPSDALYWDKEGAVEYQGFHKYLQRIAPDDFFFGPHPDQPTSWGYWRKPVEPEAVPEE